MTGDRRRLISLFALQAQLGAGAIGVYRSLILLVAAGCCGVFLLRFLHGETLPLRDIVILHAYLLGVVVASIALSRLCQFPGGRRGDAHVPVACVRENAHMAGGGLGAGGGWRHPGPARQAAGYSSHADHEGAGAQALSHEPTRK
jgi:hypothetical protein